MSRMRLDIEFAPGRAKWWLRRELLLLIPAALLLGTGAWMAHRSHDEITRDRQQAEALAKADRSAAARRKPVVDPQSEARNMAAAQLESRLNRPWAALLDIFESADMPQVAVIAVQPAQQNGAIHVVVEAASLDDMVNYFEALQKDGRLTDLGLVSHERLERVPGTPVRFQLSAQWNGLR